MTLRVLDFMDRLRLQIRSIISTQCNAAHTGIAGAKALSGKMKSGERTVSATPYRLWRPE